jgi:hypothetical protein
MSHLSFLLEFAMLWGKMIGNWITNMRRKLLTLIFALTVPGGLLAAEPPPKQEDFAGWVRPRLVGEASDSGHFSLDQSKLNALFPDFKWTDDQLGYLRDHLNRGDSRAAIVASVQPLVVAAFSDELDAVILIEFPDALVQKYKLSVGDHLVASWIYPRLRRPAPDIAIGERQLHGYNDGSPQVADFLSDSIEKLKQRKANITDHEWQRATTLAAAAMQRAQGHYRSCFPLLVWRPVLIPATAPATSPAQK